MAIISTREIALNNPGGIVHDNKTKWQGASEDQPDSKLVAFQSPQFGIRAMCRVLLSYKNRDINTISAIITAWAPAIENDTAAYIRDVAQRTGFLPDAALDVDQTAVMLPLLKAIVQHENGVNPYDDSVYQDAMRMAGIADSQPKPLAKSKNIIAATVTTIGGTTTAATEVIRQVQSVNDTVQQAHDTITQTAHLAHQALAVAPWLAVAFVLAGSVGVVYAKISDRKILGV